MTYRFVFRGQSHFATFILLLLVPVAGMSQNSASNIVRDHHYIVGREFTTENGLPANGVNSMYQDHRGYIWAATYNGLVRYNGTGFTVYNTSNLEELQSNRFITVTEDPDGRIWAGLEYNNIIMIDQEMDTTATFLIDEERFGPNAHTVDISFDSNNTPWIGTSEGLMLIQNDELVHLDHLPAEPSQHIIHTENYTYVLFEKEFYRLKKDGSIDEILLKLEDDIIHTRDKSIDEFQNVVRMVDFHFVNDDIYIMHEAGLIIMGDTTEVLLKRDEVNQIAFHGFLVDGDQFYIYGHDGMFLTDDLDLSHSEREYVYFNHRSVNDVMIDHEESVWVATNANGIQQYVSTPIYQGPKYNVLDEYAITAVLQDNSGSIWIATNCNGLYKFDKDRVQNFNQESGFTNSCIWSLMQEEDGTLWVGTWGGGVFYRQPGETRFQKFEPEILENVDVFLSIFEDFNGDIWLGTYQNGLFRYDGNQTTAIRNPDGEMLSAIRMIYEDENGEIIFATDQGIGFLEGNEVFLSDEFNVLETSNFRTIAKDSEGRLWFGSYGGGIVVYEPSGEIVTITTDDGLYDNTVSQLAFDEEGNLWLGGNLGISFVEYDQINHFLNGNQSQLQVSRLGVKEGMTIRETTGGFMPSNQLTSDGKFFVPTVQGLNVLDTNRMQLNREAPNVFVEEVELDGTVFRPDRIDEIPYDAQRIIFRFAGLSFKNPEYNQFEYILNGVDSDWQQNNNRKEAVYSSLRPGDYTLRVRASNNDGFWSESEATVSFEVIPPFWQTTWFFLATSVLFIASIIGGFRYRLRSIQKNNRQLQRMVDERTEELSISNKELKKHIEERDKLQSILAHDLRNPFSGILGYIELIRNEFDEKGDEEHVEMMNMLLDSGRNTLNLLENLLQWSGSKGGGLEPKFEVVNIKVLVNEAISMTDAQASFKNIFIRNLIKEPLEVCVDRNMILSVVRNLISNAIKFSGRDSIVEISLNEDEYKVIISVEDSGVGIPKEEIGNIFSSMGTQQKVGTQGEKGIGMGLMLCKEFIDKHEEEIWVTSAPRKGSTFSFSLKKAEEYQEKSLEQEK